MLCHRCFQAYEEDEYDEVCPHCFPPVHFERLTPSLCQLLFRVDGHIDFSDRRIVQHAIRNIKLIRTSRLFGPGRRNFKRCTYRVGHWTDVHLTWPMKWAAPCPNSLNWLPKCEFGTNPQALYNDLNDQLPLPIKPFTYEAYVSSSDTVGHTYTPEDDVTSFD